MHRIELTLPLPPSVNKMHGKGTARRRTALLNGGAVIAVEGSTVVYRREHYRAWIKEAGLEIIAARPALSGRGLPSRPYGVRIRWAEDARFDCDNGVKALLDLLVTMRITPDDRNCRHISVGFAATVPDGRCRVRVWSM